VKSCAEGVAIRGFAEEAHAGLRTHNGPAIVVLLK
jgi:hypothetical protein